MGRVTRPKRKLFHCLFAYYNTEYRKFYAEISPIKLSLPCINWKYIDNYISFGPSKVSSQGPK